MKRFCFAIALICAPLSAGAQTTWQTIAGLLEDHILPRFKALAQNSEALSQAALQNCTPSSEPLRADFGAAFDAWISASHLRFGPTEVDNRAFALAFWPDSRGATPRALNTLITDNDPIAASPQTYTDTSVAARGFYALELLLYDDALMSAGDPAYHCTLIQTISADIAITSRAILEDWQQRYGDLLKTPGSESPYRTDEEALQEMLKALSTGLQFTAESRLGRPLGSFDRPRPTRAEARRSGRSARHVMLSLTSLEDLASYLAAPHERLATALQAQFDSALERLAALDDPVFASVAVPQSRLKVEVVQQAVETIRTTVQNELGPTLGVAPGFNALDGD